MENIKLNKEEKFKEIAKRRIGEEKLDKFGTKMCVVNYVKSNNVDVQFEDKYGYVAKNVQYIAFKKSNIKNPYNPTVCNIGCIGKGKYKVTDENNKQTKQYVAFQNMLSRCYSPIYLEKHHTYQGCKVCDEWLNFQNFGKWFDENYYEIEGERVELDKDILHRGNKIYSPENCIFVPQSINLIFTQKDNEKINNLIKEATAKYKGKIPKKLYEAMINYEVEIND